MATMSPQHISLYNANNSVPRGGVIVVTKSLTGDLIDVIHDLKINKTLDIIDIQSVQIVFCILYSIIFMLGVFGNVLVCFVVFRNKAMQTVTNLFITNLALSDILLSTFAVPLTPMYTFIGRWIFGGILCYLMPYVQGTSIYISTLTLTSIAVDRFFVIMYPFHPKMKLNVCLSIIIFIWVFSLVVTCPYGLYMALQTINNKTYYCEENWPSDKSRKIFGVFTTSLQFLVPFLIITVCYICISVRLNDRTKPGTKNSRREKTDRDRKKRTNYMLIAMVTIFGVSWLPLNMINICNDFYAQFTEWNYYYLTFFLAHSMAMASTCYNPFLYAWLNDNFRKEFKQVLPFFGTTSLMLAKQRTGCMPTQKSEKICKGNDTIRGSLLPSTLNGTPASQQKIVEGYDDIENIELDNKVTSKRETFTKNNESVTLQLLTEEP